jgi:DivIVA domain-containing protein
VSMYHIVGWLMVVTAAAWALGSLSQLVAARLRGVRFTAVPASVWSGLLLGPCLASVGSGLLGHDGPRWLRWPALLLCIAALAVQVIPRVVSRTTAGLPWWRFWTVASSSVVGSASLGSPGPMVGQDTAALIERIRTARFATTRLGPGYDEKEVDNFLDKLIADLGDIGQLDQAEVRAVKFSQTRLRPGYTQHDVDDFLDEVIAWAAG